MHRLAVANSSADPATVRVDFPSPPDEVHATMLAPLAEPAPAGCRLNGEPSVPHRGWLVVEW
ncbi:hypothetical protein CK485_21445 [Streptomyces sp. ICBB 8177]|nr:hypothetical protein CK485_21445 [Streptomyces sp. ICBB 8177]